MIFEKHTSSCIKAMLENLQLFPFPGGHGLNFCMGRRKAGLLCATVAYDLSTLQADEELATLVFGCWTFAHASLGAWSSLSPCSDHLHSTATIPMPSGLKQQQLLILLRNLQFAGNFGGLVFAP